MFKGFCDENRLQILEMLRIGEKCACKLLGELYITQPILAIMYDRFFLVFCICERRYERQNVAKNFSGAWYC